MKLLSTRQQVREHWHLIAELVGQLVVLAEHVRCGTSSLEQLRRLQERLDWESDRVQVDIIERYLERKGVKREEINRLRLAVVSRGPVPHSIDGWGTDRLQSTARAV